MDLNPKRLDHLTSEAFGVPTEVMSGSQLWDCTWLLWIPHDFKPQKNINISPVHIPSVDENKNSDHVMLMQLK